MLTTIGYCQQVQNYSSRGNSASRATTTTAKTTPSDTVELSDVSKNASANLGRLPSLYGFEPRVPGRISIDEVYEHGQKFLKEFTKELNSRLKQEGVNTDIEFTLRTAFGSGDIVVTSEHPDKQKIETVFKDDFDLRNEYAKINSMFHLVESGKRASGFADAYRANPKQALAQYSYLFNTRLEASMRIADQQASVLFNRVPDSGVTLPHSA
ncbi:hypothetical protein QA601_17585 [Chitinispirillales bacterium ANBcel5]|uniref:hypothetical protein n=1 Tax=Cellulosispirillum alkaliphilum TaxID=3039283 RepID=UPI002A55E9D7|nr:hypothetical protein [Chitinispirillales bacterium ANBcel5]